MGSTKRIPVSFPMSAELLRDVIFMARVDLASLRVDIPDQGEGERDIDYLARLVDLRGREYVRVLRDAFDHVAGPWEDHP